MSSQAHHSLLMFDYPREDGGEEQDFDADKEELARMKKMFATNISHHQNKGEKEEDKEEE